MKTKNKLTKKQILLKKQAEKRSNRILIFTGIGIVLLIFASWGYQYYREYQDKNAYKEYIGLEVPKDKVCMRGDLVKHASTSQVNVNGKMYQACCNTCESMIRSNSQNRLAIDPLTKKTIDKSEAYVVLNPMKEGKVVYFESFNNFQKYQSANND
jgi:hypothetical protein